VFVLPSLSCGIQREGSTTKLETRAVKFVWNSELVMCGAIASLPMLKHVHQLVRRRKIVLSVVVNVGANKRSHIHVYLARWNRGRGIGARRCLGNDYHIALGTLNTLHSFHRVKLTHELDFLNSSFLQLASKMGKYFLLYLLFNHFNLIFTRPVASFLFDLWEWSVQFLKQKKFLSLFVYDRSNLVGSFHQRLIDC